ncbi:MAG: CDP-alcohol phosphatidyltransferase family protein [Bacteroidia bacterium]|nr:CDP-alcohol phosphatidyltransferase family protein [Bacteroidia bacterium]
MVKQIPNIITSLNLLCGCVAILLALSGDLIAAAFFILAGIIFDFFDGLAARWLNAQSELGLQLDSLADVVTSGVAPAMVMVQMLNVSVTGDPLNITEAIAIGGWNQVVFSYMPLIGLLIAVAAAYRLAKFNVDTRQTESFIGLPTPANTIFILSFPLILHFQHTEVIESIILNTWFLVAVTVFSCFIMNAEVRLFALKFKTWDYKSNKIRYIFLALCLVAIVLLKFISLPVMILLYFVLSLFRKA